MSTAVRKPTSNLSKRMLILCGTIALLQTAFAGYLGLMINDTFSQMEKVKRAKNIVGRLSRLSNLTQSMTLEVLENVTTHSHQRNPEKYTQGFTDIAAGYPKEFTQLKRDFRDYPEVRKDFEELLDNYQEGVDLMQKLRNKLTESREHYFLLYKLQEASNSTTERLEKLLVKFSRTEQAASDELKTQSVGMIVFTLAIGVSINLGIALLLFRYVFVQVTKRLKIVADNTVNLAMGKPLAAPITGDDEIAQLDNAIRDLGHILDDYKSKERTILENAAEFICSLNDKGVLIEVNQASSGLWGYSPDDLIGRRLSSLTQAESTERTLEAIDRLFYQGQSVSFENTIRKKDGEHLDLLWSAQPGEDHSSAVLIAHDITERNRVRRLMRESEERFRKIIDSLPLSVLSLNNAFQITSANPTTTKMFQYHVNELLGREFSILFTGSSTGGADDAAIVKAAETHSLELQSYRKDRSPLAVSFMANRYFNHGKEYSLAVLQDITTRREIENVKRDFISMISHDLRSPLTSLHGTLGMMAAQMGDRKEKSKTAEEQVEFETLVEAENKVGKLVCLINDFLDLEKIESGAFAFETQETTALKLVSLANDSLNEMCPDKNRTITYDTPDAHMPFRADVERLVLAVVSFALAILRFSDNSNDVSVNVERTPGRVSLFITSTGCIIPEQTRETCLKRYAIVDLAQHDTWTVSGLSLALARATVEGHRGTLSIESRNGRDGFAITLPS